MIRIDALSFGVPHADPKSDQHSQRDKEAVSRQNEFADMNKLRELKKKFNFPHTKEGFMLHLNKKATVNKVK